MKPYLVTYDIKDSKSNNYQNLFNELENSRRWWHYLANTWIIITEETANEIYNRLKPNLDSNISILIIEVGRDRQGWLSKQSWAWIKENMPKK